MVVEPLKFPSEKGFNMADHLHDSADNNRHGGSTSPDVHQLLKDISSIMRAVSPTYEPSPLSPPAMPQASKPGQGSSIRDMSPKHEPSPPSPSAMPQDSEQSQGNGDTGGRKGQTLAPKPSRKARLHSRVAANFNQDSRSLKGMPNGEHSHASHDLGSAQVDVHHHSKGKRRVPRLNIGNPDQPEGKEAPPKVEIGGGEADPRLQGSGGGGVQGRSGRGTAGGLGSAMNKGTPNQEASGEMPNQDKAMEVSQEAQEPTVGTAGWSDDGMSLQPSLVQWNLPIMVTLEPLKLSLMQIWEVK